MTAAPHPPAIGFPVPPQTRRSARNAPGHAQRLVFGLLLGLLAAASAAAVWSFAWSGVERWVNVGRLEDFPPGSVTPFGEINPVFHVVRLDNGQLLALSAANLFSRPECTVVYDPDFEPGNRRGLFRDTCYPWAFDLTGYPVNFRFVEAVSHEAGHPMNLLLAEPVSLGRIPLEIRDGAIYIDPRGVTPGSNQVRESSDLHYGATLMAKHHYSLGP